MAVTQVKQFEKIEWHHSEDQKLQPWNKFHVRYRIHPIP